MANDPLYPPANGPFVRIVTDGRPNTDIVIPDDPTEMEVFATDELASYLKRISDAEFRIHRQARERSQSFTFYLGDTRRAAEAGVRADESSVGKDGFTLRSVDDGLIVLGRGDLGTLFGVYEMLERYFDVRWFMPGEIGEHIPKRGLLEMGQIDLAFKPSFRIRRVGSGTRALQQRMNAWVKGGSEVRS